MRAEQVDEVRDRTACRAGSWRPRPRRRRRRCGGRPRCSRRDGRAGSPARARSARRGRARPCRPTARTPGSAARETSSPSSSRPASSLADWQCDSITCCTERPAVARNLPTMPMRRRRELPWPRWRATNTAIVSPGEVVVVGVGVEGRLVAEQLGQLARVGRARHPGEQRRVVGRGADLRTRPRRRSASRMAITVWRRTRSIGRPMPRSDTSDSVATSSDSLTGSAAIVKR